MIEKGNHLIEQGNSGSKSRVWRSAIRVPPLFDKAIESCTMTPASDKFLVILWADRHHSLQQNSDSRDPRRWLICKKSPAEKLTRLLRRLQSRGKVCQIPGVTRRRDSPNPDITGRIRKVDSGGTISMKKVNLLIALVLLAGTIANLPAIAQAQDDKAAQKAEAERVWYDICYTKKPTDVEKCYQLSKDLKEKHPDTGYIKNVDAKILAYEQTKAWEKFQAALKANYEAPQSAGKLEQLYTTGEEYYKFLPNEPYVVLQLALASTNGVLGAIQYKNLDKAKGYVEKAMKLFEATTPAKDYTAEQWNAYRELVGTQGNQYIGYYLIETNGNQDQALEYLTKATQIKAKDGSGWKDPNNYLLRSGIYTKKYEALRKQYDALPDDAAKTGDAGKELLKQVNELLDKKLIPEYARVLAAAATKPDYKPLLDQTKPLFESFWKYRTDAPEKAPAFLDAFKADPTVAGPEVPAKAESSATLDAPAAPVGGGVKPMAGTAAVAPGAKGAATNGNGGKAAPAAKGGSKKSGRRRR
jgi:hypothetical protein